MQIKLAFWVYLQITIFGVYIYFQYWLRTILSARAYAFKFYYKSRWKGQLLVEMTFIGVCSEYNLTALNLMNIHLNVNISKEIIIITFPYEFNNIVSKQNSWLIQMIKNLYYVFFFRKKTRKYILCLL